MASNSKTPVVKNGSKFVNPFVKWPFGYVEGATRMIKWLYSMTKFQTNRPNLEANLPIKIPYFKSNKNPDSGDMIRATWLGHASVLVYIDGFHILCDPIFSSQCAPPMGPTRFREAPCEVSDLPNIDAIVLSHNHYDHMDSKTIRLLNVRFPDVQWIIPANDKKNLINMGPTDNNNITEMMWWEKKEIKKDGKRLTIHFTPTQHWSNRGIFDSFKSLWGSYALIGSTHKFWFAGDTGYCKRLFEEIGNEFGPFDAAAIPIGAYEPRDLTVFQHCDPDEAVEIHKDVKSKVSFGIHWGTFRLTSERYMDPKERLEAAVKNKKSKENETIDFITIDHGETLEVINSTVRVFSGDESGPRMDNNRSMEKEYQCDEANTSYSDSNVRLGKTINIRPEECEKDDFETVDQRNL